MKWGQLVEEPARQKPDMVGVLFFIVIIPCQIQSAEPPDTGNDRWIQMIPEEFEENTFPEPVHRQLHLFHPQALHDRQQNHRTG